MKQLGKIFAALAAASVLVACSDSDGVSVATYRVLHAVPDAPQVNVLVDGAAALQGVDYKAGSDFASVNAATYSVQVDAIVPGGVATVIGPADVTLAANTETSIIAVGTVATIEPLIHSRAVDTVPAGSARAEVIHGSPSAPPVDVYVTAFGADLASSAKLGDTTIAFKDSIGPVDVPAGNYQIRVTVQGQTDPASIVFDSGEVTLTDGADLLIVAVESTGANTQPISLLLWGAGGVTELLDVATPANLRVVHASPDAPAVDVVVNNDFAMPLVPALSFPDVAPANGYVTVPADTYNIKVTDSATQGLVPIDADVPFAAGSETTVVAVDTLANIRPLLLDDNNRRLATAAKVRLVHGSPSAGAVDIYVTASGDIADVDPDFAGVELEANTGYVELAEGSYVVTVTGPGSKTPALTVPVAVVATGVYTAIVRDNPAGPDPFSVITLDDF